METHEGFSIREYVSRMRSVNVVKCWPFDEGTGEESVKSLLPPITVKKFTWWLDELELLHSKSSKNVDSSKTRKKKKKFLEKGESSLRSGDDLEESDVDVREGMDVVKVKCPKAKAKAPKRRSILEIFAVAPPVERVISSESEDEDENEEEDGCCSHEEINWGLKGKRNEKKKKKKYKKNKEIILSKLKKSKKVINKIKIKKGYDKTIDPSIPNKENCFTFKLRDQDKVIGNPGENENDVRDRVSIRKKKPRLQHVSGDKKTKACDQALKLTAINQHPENPKRGILRNPGNLQEAVQMNHCGKQKADKHVTFDVFRLSRQQAGPVECFMLQNYHGLDMQNVDHAVDAGKDSAIVETSGTETELEPFSRSITSDITLDGKDQHTFDMGLKEAPHDPQYACLPGFARMPREANYNSRNVNVIMKSSSSTGGRLIKDLRTSGPRVPQICFKDYLGTHSEPSALNYYEKLPHFSPRELLQTVSSSPYRTGNIHGSIHGINEGFVGLPLNSQGELIRMSSRGKGDLNEMIKSSTIAAPAMCLSHPSTVSECFGEHSEHRSWDWRTSSRDQLNLFPVDGYSKENPVVFVPSRLDITEARGNGQTNLDLNLVKINDHSFNSENYLCKEDNLGNEILPTMRLMGKEFIVGRRGFQKFEEEHIWKDKQVIDELHFNDTSFDNVMMHDRYQNEASLAKLKETLLSIDHRSGSMHTFPHFDCQTSSMHESNGFVATRVTPGLCCSNFAAVRNSEPLFPEPFPIGYKSQVFNLELPMPQAAHQDSHLSVSSSDIQLKNKQNLSHAPRSAIRFPFMHPDLEEHPQSSRSGSSYVNQSPSFVDVSKKGTLMSNFQPYRNLDSKNHPSVVPRTNHWTNSSVSLKPEASCLYNPFSFGSTLQSSMGPPSSPPTFSTQQAPTVCYPVVMPISSLHERHGNQNKIREQIKSRIAMRHLGRGRKSKRQPSVPSSVSFQPVMMPSLGIEEGSKCTIAKPNNSFNFENVEAIETALESCSSTNKSNILMCDEYGDDQSEQRTYPWIDSYSRIASSGANKLTGEAKHILKACPQIDQNSSWYTDPNIPFTATTADFRLTESDNPAKIYKL